MFELLFKDGCKEMGCLGDSQGVLAVSTDDEEAVGHVFSRLQVGKDVRVSKAPPQGQANERISGEICEGYQREFCLCFRRTATARACRLRDRNSCGSSFGVCLFHVE